MRPARLDHSFFDNEPRSHLGAVRLRICFEDDIARVLAEQANVEFVDIGVTSVDYRAVEMLPFEHAERLRAIPLRLHSDGIVSVAVADPTDATLLAELKLALGS